MKRLLLISAFLCSVNLCAAEFFDYASSSESMSSREASGSVASQQPLHKAPPPPPQQQPPLRGNVETTPSVLVTNKTDHELLFEWQVSLSRNVHASGRENVAAGAENFNADDRLNWMVSPEEAKQHPVFTISVKISSMRDHKMIAQKTVQKTLSHATLHGDNPKNNLHIVYTGGSDIGIFVDK